MYLRDVCTLLINSSQILLGHLGPPVVHGGIPEAITPATFNIHLYSCLLDTYSQASLPSIIWMVATLLDSYQRHKTVAKMGSRSLHHLFRCSMDPPYKGEGPRPNLKRFIVYLLHFSELPSDTVYVALFFLQRLKHRHYMRKKKETGYHFFLPAFMLASKYDNDKSPSNRWWTRASLNIWTLRQINKMERHLCSRLDWDLTIDPGLLARFSERISLDFASCTRHPHPTYGLSTTSVSAAIERRIKTRERTEVLQALGVVNGAALQRPAYFLPPARGDFQMLDVKGKPTCAHLYVFTAALPSRW
ncbi:hypothetical protein BDZ94DRAFT_1262542 [Collybia nuda]|uniref:Cyclin N-terminal domain-containing protein n=1 Tax=Collybia nuda TaxID=64659 RepID=A0A9P6CH52_9AGAR|nr:hypothetical protein BDZ94DRAFT_1262542 [Collybia nuda]